MAIVPLNFALGASYYVSESEGNDLNNGTSVSNPWKTLTKVGTVIFQAGDIIHLKKGDTWVDQTLLLKGQGTSANWIKLTSYGSATNKPKVTFSSATQYLRGINIVWANDYWEIDGIEVSGSYYGIYRANGNPTNPSTGLRIQNCYIHGCVGPSYPNNLIQNIKVNHAAAICISKVNTNVGGSDITIQDVLIKDCSSAIMIIDHDDVEIERVDVINQEEEGLLFGTVNNGTITDCTFDGIGIVGMSYGVAAIQFNVCSDVTVSNCVIKNVYNNLNDWDGVGVDLEGNNENITVDNCHMQQLGDAGLMVYRNPDWGVDNKNITFTNNTLALNGLKDVTKWSSGFKWIKNWDVQGTISNNEIIRYYGGDYSRHNNGLVDDYFNFGNTTVSNNTLAIRWPFEADEEGWVANNRISNFEVVDGVLKGTIIANDPFIKSPDDLSIDAVRHTQIRVEYKNLSSSTVGKIYFITEDDSAWNENKAKTFSITPNDTQGSIYTVDMGSVAGWTGRLKRLRLDPSTSSSGSFEIEHFDVVGNSDNGNDGETLAWVFNTNGDPQGWTANGAISNFDVINEHLEGDIVSSDPFIISPDNLGYDLNKYTKIAVRYQNATPDTYGVFFFTTTSEQNWDQAKSVSFDIIENDSDDYTYTIDMSKNSNWTGTLKQLRFDPSPSSTGSFGIEIIELVDDP